MFGGRQTLGYKTRELSKNLYLYPNLRDMRIIVLCCLLSFSPWYLSAQSGLPPTAGARSAALGSSGLNFTDINSIFSNQAGLADLESLSFTLVGENRFFLNEIKSLSAGAALPTGVGTFGLSLNYYGFELYNEQRIGLAYARKLMDRLSIGAQFVWLNTNIPEYGNQSTFTFELGLQAKLSKRLSLGFHTFNPARAKLVGEERLPTLLALGLQYQPSDKLYLLAEVEKDLDYTVRTRFGAEYQLVEQLWLRLGIATQPVEYSFGLGYTLKSGFRLDASARYHQVLGFSPGIGLTYSKPKSGS
ncbi:MAG: hypothetical protein DHS20C18_09730 [Saprospiraceae bacterium]|nr:MAG: hypothetical protein DHS20C18_09730 [Saprospiraceae bacterium]